MCNVVSGSALPIIKSKIVKTVALELEETLSVFQLAQLVLVRRTMVPTCQYERVQNQVHCCTGTFYVWGRGGKMADGPP